MAHVGSLRDLTLPELLAIIANGEKSGVITIKSDAATAQIHVAGGRIVMASDTLRDERFGEVMLKLGKISQEVLARALAAQKTSGGARRLGSILVEMKAITNKDQDQALLYQTCEALYDLCTWQVGYFQFDAQEAPDTSGISIQVDTLLEEVDRRAVAGSARKRNRSGRSGRSCADDARSRRTRRSSCASRAASSSTPTSSRLSRTRTSSPRCPRHRRRSRTKPCPPWTARSGTTTRCLRWTRPCARWSLRSMRFSTSPISSPGKKGASSARIALTAALPSG